MYPAATVEMHNMELELFALDRASQVFRGTLRPLIQKEDA